jgi:hypothetical protein
MTSLLKRDIPVRATLVALALALLATAVTGREDGPAAESVPPAATPEAVAPAVVPATDQELDLDKLERRDQAEKVPDLFAMRDPAPQPRIARPPPGAATEPAMPSVPPLPFTYLGQVLDSGKVSVFLAQGSEHYSVRAGQKIGEYRVEKILDDAVVLTYLPLGRQQILTIPVPN